MRDNCPRPGEAGEAIANGGQVAGQASEVSRAWARPPPAQRLPHSPPRGAAGPPLFSLQGNVSVTQATWRRVKPRGFSL